MTGGLPPCKCYRSGCKPQRLLWPSLRSPMLSCPVFHWPHLASPHPAWKKTLQGPRYQEVRIIRTILEIGQGTELAIGKQSFKLRQSYSLGIHLKVVVSSEAWKKLLWLSVKRRPSARMPCNIQAQVLFQRSCRQSRRSDSLTSQTAQPSPGTPVCSLGSVKTWAAYTRLWAEARLGSSAVLRLPLRPARLDACLWVSLQPLWHVLGLRDNTPAGSAVSSRGICALRSLGETHSYSMPRGVFSQDEQ